MLSKVQLTGTIKLDSGLHIGGNDAFAAIGAIDLPVIKDPLTNLPLLPGTSLKGKMRSLLAKAYNEHIAKTPNNDDERIVRLFGATNGGGEDGDLPIQARLIFRDSILSNTTELMESGVESYTEAKFENTIDRVTAGAKPRQIERVIRGSEFEFELIYDVVNPNEVAEDIQTIKDGLKLLELDYLGGSGSRGYGKVHFEDPKAVTVFGDFDASGINEVLGE